MGLNKIEMHIAAQNSRSLKLAAKLGAQQEGILRQSTRLAGKLEDVVVTGILKSEWEAMHSAHTAP